LTQVNDGRGAACVLTMEACPKVANMKIDAHQLGLVLGLFMAAWHGMWSLLVVTGLAQRLLDFVFWMHFITPAFHVEAFEPLRALVLVVVTGLFGYLVGLVAGLIWNAVHRA
jgi:hypothetical protein